MWQTLRILGMYWWICAIVVATLLHFSRRRLLSGTGPRHLYRFRHTSSCLSYHCCCQWSFLQLLPRIAAACSSSAAQETHVLALFVLILLCIGLVRAALVLVFFALLAVVSIYHRRHQNRRSRLRQLHLQVAPMLRWHLLWLASFQVVRHVIHWVDQLLFYRHSHHLVVDGGPLQYRHHGFPVLQDLRHHCHFQQCVCSPARYAATVSDGLLLHCAPACWLPALAVSWHCGAVM